MIKKHNFDDFYNTIKASIIPYSVFIFIILKLFPIQKPLQLVNDYFTKAYMYAIVLKGFQQNFQLWLSLAFKAFVFF